MELLINSGVMGNAKTVKEGEMAKESGKTEKEERITIKVENV